MPSWVGDVVMATPALRAVRGRFSEAHIAWLIRPNTLDVVQGMPWADEIIPWQPVRSGFSKAWDPFRLAGRLRRGRFDTALLLSNAFRAALVTKLAGIGRRVGYDRDGRGLLLTTGLKPRRNTDPRNASRYAFVSAVRAYNELAVALGCEPPSEEMALFTTAEDEAMVEERLSGWGIAGHHPLVVINPGASFGISKLWLPQRYAAVGDSLIDRQDARIVLTCGPGEESLAWRIHDTMRREAFVVDQPRGTLGQLKALIRRCDLLLNNDTGPRHFAKAFGRPVVTVFGSTHPEWTHTDYPLERIVRVPVDCGPCQKKVCPFEHHQCMTGVTVEMVYEAARDVLEPRRAPAARHGATP